MIKEYTQSCERYKGFILEIVMTCLDDNTLRYHRSCHVSKGVFPNAERITICKTKKEAKELIDGGYLK